MSLDFGGVAAFECDPKIGILDCVKGERLEEADLVGLDVSEETKARMWSASWLRYIVDVASLYDTRSFGRGRDIYQDQLDISCCVRQYKEHVVCNTNGRTISEAHRVAEWL